MVKEIRNALKMTQVEFAEKLGIHGGSLSVIEAGRTDVTKQNIFLICTSNRPKEGVTINKKWLRDGQGEMFVPKAVDGRPKLFENGEELPADEEELIGVYRDLITENKKIIQDNTHMILETQETTKKTMGKPSNVIENGI